MLLANLKGRHVRAGKLPYTIITFDYGGWALSLEKLGHLHWLFKQRRSVSNWRSDDIFAAPNPALELDRQHDAFLTFMREHAATNATEEELRTDPFFTKSSNRSPSGISVLYGGATPAAKQAAATFVEANLPELLARMVPAITGPAGSRPVDALNESDYDGGNINLEDHQTAPWPRPKQDGHSKPWRHRDHRRVAYGYVGGLYLKFTSPVVFNIRWNAGNE